MSLELEFDELHAAVVGSESSAWSKDVQWLDWICGFDITRARLKWPDSTIQFRHQRLGMEKKIFLWPTKKTQGVETTSGEKRVLRCADFECSGITDVFSMPDLIERQSL